MSERRRLLLSRRDLLKAGGLTVVAAGAAAFGPRVVGRLVAPDRALAVDRPPDLKLVGTDGWISLPPAPSIFSSSLGVTVHPDPYAPDGKSTYVFGFANATGLSDANQFHLKEPRPAQRTAVLGPRGRGVQGPAHERRPRPTPGPVRRAHAPLAWLQERHPVLRRRTNRLDLRPAGADVHVRLRLARPWHVHVPLPRRGHRARAHGDDGHRVRPSGPGRHQPWWVHEASCSTTTATARPGSTASTPCS